jgi:hypothetical protein
MHIKAAIFGCCVLSVGDGVRYLPDDVSDKIQYQKNYTTKLCLYNSSKAYSASGEISRLVQSQGEFQCTEL